MTTNTKTVAFVNLKGGVGKTTSAIGTAEALARLGHTVTVRDADPSGAATLEPLNMFAPMPIGIALIAASLAYFHFFGSRLLREEEDEAVTPARTQSYIARAYGIDGDDYELTVTADIGQ